LKVFKPIFSSKFIKFLSEIFIAVLTFASSARFFLKPIEVPSGVSIGQNLP